jgi:hypothetical protein
MGAPGATLAFPESQWRDTRAPLECHVSTLPRTDSVPGEYPVSTPVSTLPIRNSVPGEYPVSTLDNPPQSPLSATTTKPSTLSMQPKYHVPRGYP